MQHLRIPEKKSPFPPGKKFQEGVLEETQRVAVAVVVNYPASRWDRAVTVTTNAGEAEP